jgi:hypothetical protein
MPPLALGMRSVRFLAGSSLFHIWQLGLRNPVDRFWWLNRDSLPHLRHAYHWSLGTGVWPARWLATANPFGQLIGSALRLKMQMIFAKARF